MKILVTGATGVMGRRVTAELAQSGEIEELLITSRDGSEATRVASLFGGGRVRGAALDVTDTSAFIGLARGVDVVVNAAGPGYLFEVECVRATIDAGTHYVSLCDDVVVTERVAALDPAARDAGVTVISGCGLSPGLTNLMVGLAAAELDEPEEIEIALGASSADPSGQATTLHFLAMMASTATSITDHTNDDAPAGTAPKLIYFPDPVGWVETFRSGHPEVTTMATTYPNLRFLRFRIGLTERAAMDVVRASAAARLLASEKQRRLWLRVSEPLRPMLESMPPRGASWTSARVDVRGAAGGRAQTVSLAVVDRIANLAAVPLARAALEAGTAGLKKGVLTPEAAFEPRSFLGSVSRRGVRVARLDPLNV